MAEVYVNGEFRPVNFETDGLMKYLPFHLPMGTEIAIDTEASGLFVDGNFSTTKDSDTYGPARVSVVSLSWREYWDCGHCEACQYSMGPIDPPCMDPNTKIVDIAIPFDQGRIPGKLGVWKPRGDPQGHFETIEPFCTKCGKAKEKHKPIPAKGRPKTKNPQCYHPDYEPDNSYLDWNCGPAEWLQLVKWLNGRPLVMHHKKYDCHIVAAGLRTPTGNPHLDAIMNLSHGEWDCMPQVVWDTMLAQAVIEPLESVSLKTTAQRLWGYQEGDEQRVVKAALKKNGVGLTQRYDLLDWPDIAKYAAQDTHLTLRLRERHQRMIAEGEVPSELLNAIEGWVGPDRKWPYGELRMSTLLYRMENSGVKFDGPKMLEEAKIIQSEIDEVASKLPFRPPNVNAAKKYFFDEKKILPVKRTDPSKTYPWGQPSLDAESVRHFVDAGVPDMDTWQRVAELESVMSKWYMSWPMKVGKDGRARTSYRQGRMESDRPGQNAGGAISGRLSVERFQIHATPRDETLPKGVTPIKRFFGAKDGYELWELDISQAEVRIGASLARCENLRLAVCSPDSDLHTETTKMIFGVDKDAPQWNELRAVGKRITLGGGLYGAGVKTIRTNIKQYTGLDYGEARTRDMLNQWHMRFPEIGVMQRRVQRKADRAMGGCGWIRLITGRIRMFGWGEYTHKAWNQLVQGSQAEVIKVVMLRVEQEFPGILLNMVHDSLWLEVPAGAEGERMRNRVSAIMSETFEYFFSRPEFVVPFFIDAKRMA